MAKFCGACGTRNEDDNAVRCCKCGAFFTNSMNSPVNSGGYSGNSNGSSYGYNNGGGNYSENSNSNNYSYNNGGNNQPVNYQYIQGADKGGKAVGRIIKSVIALLLAAVLVLGCTVIYRYTGYRAVLNYFKIYFDEYEYSKIVDNYSTVVFDTANPDNNYAELDDDAKAKLDSMFDFFDSELGGSGYSLKFETVENYRMTDNQYDDFMNGIDYAEKDEIIKDARIAEFKVTASLDGKKTSKNVELIITLEDENKWKIYSFNEAK